MSEPLQNPQRALQFVQCPRCEGRGRVFRTIPGVPRDVCVASEPCQTCWPREADGSLKFWNDGTAGSVVVGSSGPYTGAPK